MSKSQFSALMIALWVLILVLVVSAVQREAHHAVTTDVLCAGLTPYQQGLSGRC